MKAVKTIQILTAVILSSLMFSCTSDGDGPGPIPDEVLAQSELTGQLTEAVWNLNSAAREDVDVSTDFNDFRLNFRTDGTYSTENGGIAWEPSGTWAYPNFQTTDQILVDGDILMDLEIIGNSLKLSFSIEEEVFSRTKTVNADYEFELRK